MRQVALGGPGPADCAHSRRYDPLSAVKKGEDVYRSATLAAILVSALLVAGCSDEPTEYDVTTTVVSHETTQDIWVFAPEGEGPWPIVFTYHGQGGTGDGLAITAENLARNGLLVFSPTYRSTEPQHVEQDLECAYRYGLSIAADYGGDLDEPITSFGHSFGGQMAILGALSEATYGPDGTYDKCFTGAPRPEVIVSATACYYESPDGFRYPFETTGFANHEAELLLIGGPEDDVCELWQSQDATETLRAAGYSATLTAVGGGNHANVAFYEVIDGEWIERPDDPVGHEVIRLTLGAIDAAGE